jgi:hypothetical protein
LIFHPAGLKKTPECVGPNCQRRAPPLRSVPSDGRSLVLCQVNR